MLKSNLGASSGVKKGNSFFWGGGCQKNGFWQFPSKSTFYPINKFQKVAHKVRATRDIIFRQGSEPIRPHKSPQKTQNHVKCPPSHDTPIPSVPWYPSTMVPHVPWVPLVPCLPRYHGTKVPWHHGPINFEPYLGGRRLTYPGGAGGGAAPRAKRKKDA